MSRGFCGLELLLRLILGGALIWAGGSKLFDPAMFAAAIATFQILPAMLIPAAALTLPLMEIMLGAMLVTGWRLRLAAFSATVLFTTYTVALALGLARHLPLECDCFGSSTSAPHALIRDCLLLAAAAALYGRQVSRAGASGRDRATAISS